ncbi:MAG: hypothetical protein HY902_18275 [Deltaproteobacteria bacterium]|nr:hypothetical protein [Deltaproteobacteria bacterium]
MGPGAQLDAVALLATFAAPIAESTLPPTPPAPMAAADDGVRKAIRDVLRQGGFKPTGRSKPASEFLLGAEAQGAFPTINPPIDICNRVSLHSGMPISAIDADRIAGPLSIRMGGAGEEYVFNSAGHAIDLEGLLCLCDGEGACANAVKDAQRTKTTSDTKRLLVIVWGSKALPGLSNQTAAWLQAWLAAAGATVEPVACRTDA